MGFRRAVEVEDTQPRLVSSKSPEDDE